MARRAKLNPALSTLYNAPDVRENRRLRGGIAEIEPERIAVSGRLDDRLGLDVADLTASIQRNGQRVPILVRPGEGDSYQLIYGRRRLEACRQLDRPVRAIVTELEDDQALKDQLLENQERRDLSFIERALVAAALVEGDHLPEGERSNKAVAEVLNLTEAGLSQMLGVVRTVGDDLIRAIGPAPGIGRPRWEELKRAIAGGAEGQTLLEAAATAERGGATGERSDAAFLAVLKAAQPKATPAPRDAGHAIPGVGTARLSRSGRGRNLRIDIAAQDAGFAGWLEREAPALIAELHGRWNARKTEDEQSQQGDTTGSA
ncbi:plasmid partitioning protein RepB [Roseivivax sp. CAU 1761]